LLTVQEARDAGILGIDITSVTDKFMKENPGMLRTFIEVTHEANARYAAGKSDMGVIAKDAEMKLGDMKETIGGFKFLTPSETEQSMTSGNLAGFLKGMGTPDGAVDTSFLPL
jgi:taurine transport system substrate-binding protein